MCHTTSNSGLSLNSIMPLFLACHGLILQIRPLTGVLVLSHLHATIKTTLYSLRLHLPSLLVFSYAPPSNFRKYSVSLKSANPLLFVSLPLPLLVLVCFVGLITLHSRHLNNGLLITRKNTTYTPPSLPHVPLFPPGVHSLTILLQIYTLLLLAIPSKSIFHLPLQTLRLVEIILQASNRILRHCVMNFQMYLKLLVNLKTVLLNTVSTY